MQAIAPAVKKIEPSVKKINDGSCVLFEHRGKGEFSSSLQVIIYFSGRDDVYAAFTYSSKAIIIWLSHLATENARCGCSHANSLTCCHVGSSRNE